VRAAPVLAATEYPTVPLPDPLDPLVIVNQEAFDEAVQAHAVPAVTETLPVEAVEPGLALVGLIEYVQVPPDVIVKLAFETSKKMLPTARTRMRQVVLGVFGTVMACEPSFGVEASTFVQFVPPSVDRSIATFAATLPPPTVHVTVWDELPAHETAVFGAVTANGVPETVTVTGVIAPVGPVAPLTATPPPPAWLSRTVSTKRIVRSTVGVNSHVVPALLPASTWAIAGIVREGELDGEIERTIGCVVLVVPRSHCSQQ
jgi:hypothetical protein